MIMTSNNTRVTVNHISLALRTRHHQFLKLLYVVSLPWCRHLHSSELEALTSGHIGVIFAAVVTRFLARSLTLLDVNSIRIKHNLDLVKSLWLKQLHITLKVRGTALAELKLINQVGHDGRIEEDLFFRIVEGETYIDKASHT